jgi:hypothetical protein
MKERNKFILFFIVLAFLCFCIIQFIIIPQAQFSSDRNAQDDAMTPDLTAVMEYQIPSANKSSAIEKETPDICGRVFFI